MINWEEEAKDAECHTTHRQCNKCRKYFPKQHMDNGRCEPCVEQTIFDRKKNVPQHQHRIVILKSSKICYSCKSVVTKGSNAVPYKYLNSFSQVTQGYLHEGCCNVVEI